MFKLGIGFFERLAAIAQLLPHLLQRAGQLGDLSPGGVGADWLVKVQPADALAVVGQRGERFAKAPGDTNGDRHT